MASDKFVGPNFPGGAKYPNRSSINQFYSGRFTTVSATQAGATANARLQLPGGTSSAMTPLFSGVRIKADAANAEPIFIAGGKTASVAGGFHLSANEEVFIDICRLENIHIMSVGGGETGAFIAS